MTYNRTCLFLNFRGVCHAFSITKYCQSYLQSIVPHPQLYHYPQNTPWLTGVHVGSHSLALSLPSAYIQHCLKKPISSFQNELIYAIFLNPYASKNTQFPSTVCGSPPSTSSREFFKQRVPGPHHRFNKQVFLG